MPRTLIPSPGLNFSSIHGVYSPTFSGQLLPATVRRALEPSGSRRTSNGMRISPPSLTNEFSGPEM